MRVAAYQASLFAAGSMEPLDRIRDRVQWCEREGVSILCCPEAILGGLADNDGDPRRFAISAADGSLEALLAPIASASVTTIIGFTESEGSALFNSAAVFHEGRVAGVYRKRHPAIRRSVYTAGTASPVFQIGGLRFGIAICNDSNFQEPFRLLAAQRATAVFVPSNNALPPGKGGPELAREA